MAENANNMSWDDCVRAVGAASPRMALAEHSRAARRVAQLLAAGELPAGVRPIRLALLRSVTAEVLAPSLVARLAEAGLAGEVALGQLGNIGREMLADDSFLFAERFDACIVWALAEHVLPGVLDPSAGFAEDSARQWIESLKQLARRLARPVVAVNFALPPQLLAGSLSAQSPDGGRYGIAQANRMAAQAAAELPNLIVCDLEALAGAIGGAQFWSPRDMAASMQPLSPAGIAALAGQLANLLRLYHSTPIKCIVLDCDNTLWGGVIGEDGPDGIQLGETYPGLCFQQFQRQLAQLSRLGFLLAINSRNNPADVDAVFDRHPGMALKRSDIAAERVNWQDKAANLAELAEELGLGLDSFLFIDDSPFEIELVRRQLPQVHCLQAPAEPWRLPGLLADCPLLDRLRLADEDRRKVQMYAQERQRKEFLEQSTSVSDYLRDLGIRMKFERFDPREHLKRAAQLTQKTNQFNLTMKRCTEADLLAAHNQGNKVYLASLSDRFGDYGRIAMAMACPEPPDAARLDVFLLSCRVIGRGVEDSFLRLVMADLKPAGIRRLDAYYVPADRNGLCRDFLAKAGFQRTGSADEATERYAFDLSGPVAGPADWVRLDSESGHEPDVAGHLLQPV